MYVVWGDITVGTGSSIDPVTPTKIHIRKEFVKTKVSRDIYISDEATRYLKQWLEWKYNNKERPRTVNQDDLAFTLHTSANPNTVYVKILEEFEKLLAIAGLDERKEGMTKRRKITLHSLRRFVKTVISDQVNQDYSEWFLDNASESMKILLQKMFFMLCTIAATIKINQRNTLSTVWIYN
jgi:integrase